MALSHIPERGVRGGYSSEGCRDTALTPVSTPVILLLQLFKGTICLNLTHKKYMQIIITVGIDIPGRTLAGLR